MSVYFLVSFVGLNWRRRERTSTANRTKKTFELAKKFVTHKKEHPATQFQVMPGERESESKFTVLCNNKVKTKIEFMCPLVE